MNDDMLALETFSGTARLFPLPNLVLFPHVVQPLHIFEPRYRAMTADALDGDRLIALVLLAPGWEENYDGQPALYPVACLGRVVADQKLPDGRYNLLLRGLKRVRILEELPGEAYRVARVEIVVEPPLPPLAELRELRRILSEAVLPRFDDNPARQQLHDLFEGELSLGSLCDVLAFALPIALEEKQALLEVAHVAERTTRLVAALDAATAPVSVGGESRKFPPDFSDN